MTRRQRLETKIKSAFDAQHVDVVDESGNHNVPPGSESHFKLVLVTKGFEGKTLVERHRMVYAVVGDEMKSGLHALALHTYTPQEWVTYQAGSSPPCLGGSKK